MRHPRSGPQHRVREHAQIIFSQPNLGWSTVFPRCMDFQWVIPCEMVRALGRNPVGFRAAAAPALFEGIVIWGLNGRNVKETGKESAAADANWSALIAEDGYRRDPVANCAQRLPDACRKHDKSKPIRFWDPISAVF